MSNAYNSDYPIYGSLYDRIGLMKKMNKKIEELCNIYKFEYLDVYNLYVNSEGGLDASKSDGGVHVNPFRNSDIKDHLIEQLEKRDRISF
jgi:hypothetical protein